MRRSRVSCIGALVAGFLVTACIGTTGSGVVSFKAFAAGPADLPADVSTGGLSFGNAYGWSITLTRARLHIGGLFLNRSVPVSGGQERACYLPGVYVAQVLTGLDVDVLSSTLQPFPGGGNGTADLGVTGEVWLTGGRVDAEDDATTIVDVAGTATRDAVAMRFEGTLTIGRNRAIVSTDPALPGANPLCAERIVSPIATSIVPDSGGSFVVRVDPRAWFRNVDLGELEPVTPTSDLHRIPDGPDPPAAENLFLGVRAASGVYTFEWQP